MSEHRVQTFCQHCHMKCRVSVTVKDGKVEHIANRMGVSCPKHGQARDVLYHPQRVIYPLKRMGARGQGKWERVSWEEALATMARRFTDLKEEYGPEAVATIRG